MQSNTLVSVGFSDARTMLDEGTIRAAEKASYRRSATAGRRRVGIPRMVVVDRPFRSNFDFFRFGSHLRRPKLVGR
jgi:hypothetical protein